MQRDGVSHNDTLYNFFYEYSVNRVCRFCKENFSTQNLKKKFLWRFKQMKKRVVSAMLAVAMVGSLMAACNQKPGGGDTGGGNEVPNYDEGEL